MKFYERMNLSKRHSFLSFLCGFVVLVFFVRVNSFSQTSDSTIQALQKRIQILEQKVLQLEYLISTKSDTTKKVESKEENSSSVIEKKEEFI